MSGSFSRKERKIMGPFLFFEIETVPLFQKGFTLIELVMVIVITGILSAVAVPKYFDLQDKAKLAAENGVVGGVRSGIYTYFTYNKA